MSRGSSERAFQKAKRHSRIVRILRVVLPTVVALTAIGITVSTYLSPLLAPLPAKMDNVVVSGSRVTMDHPHMSGFTRDGRAYELKARAAIQDVTKPDVIELHKIDAKMEMQNHGTVRLTSPKGIYDSKAEKLKLDENVLISSSDGYRGRLKEARVSVKTGRVISDKPVEMKMLKGTLNANRMEILDSGGLIRFDQGVQLTTFLNPAAIKQKAAHSNDNTSGKTNTAANNVSGGQTTRLVLTRLPLPDPRRLLASRAAPMQSRP